MTPQTLTATAAGNVKAAMQTAGENPHSLALKAGIARPTLLRRLDGVTPFTVDELDRIALTLGVTAASFLANNRDEAAA